MPKQQSWVKDILSQPVQQQDEQPESTSKAQSTKGKEWVSDILAKPPVEKAVTPTPKPSMPTTPPAPVTPAAPVSDEGISLQPERILGSLANPMNMVKNLIKPTNPKEHEAGYLDLVAAGMEQGATPFLPQVAIKGGIGAAGAGKGALAKTAGALEGVFDPNVTVYAKTTRAKFPEHMTTPQEAALIGGNILGSVAKTVATGGIGGADVLARLGAGGMLKQLGKRAGYEAAKQGVGVTGGMGGALAANKVLEMTPMYQNASPEEQQQMSVLASTVGGVGAGIGADRLASALVKRTRPLAQARDIMVEGSNIPTYEQMERAKAIKEAAATEPVQEILKTPEPGMQEPIEYPRTAEEVNKGAISPSEATDIEAQTLANIRQSHNKIAKATFKAEDAIVKPYENTVLKEPSRVADEDFANSVKQIQEVAKKEYTPVEGVKLNEYEPAGYSQLSSGHKIEFTGQGEQAKSKFIPAADTATAIENGTATNDIQAMISAHNDIIGSEGGAKNKNQVMIDSLQNYLDDINSSTGKTAAEKIGVMKGLLQDTGLPEASVEKLVSQNGRVNANEVIDAYNKTGLTGDSTAVRSGRDIATEYMLHAEPKGLTENDAKFFYDQLVGKQGREEKGVNMQNNSRELANNESLGGAERTFSALNEFVSPTDSQRVAIPTPQLNETYAKISESLGLPPGEIAGLFSKVSDSRSSIDEKIKSWQDINSLFGGMSKMLSSPIPSGYAHPGMAGIVKHSLAHIPQTLEKLNFAKEIENLSKHPTEQDFSAALKRAKATTKEQLKPRESLSIGGQELKLIDNAGLPSIGLQNATEALHAANQSHPISAISGKDVPAATWLVHLDRMLKNKHLSDLSLGETGKMITQLNYAERAHGDSGKFIHPARKLLQAHQEALLRQEYGDNADKVIEAMRKIKATQKFNIQSSQATDLTQPQKMTSQNQHGKALTGLEDFTVPQAHAKLAEAEEALRGTPLEGTVNAAEHAEHVERSMQGLKRLSQVSGKYKEFIKGSEQMAKGSAVSPTGERITPQLGKSDKYTSLADIYHVSSGEGLETAGKEAIRGSLANGVITGKPDAKKIDTVRQMAINLDDAARFETPAKQQEMKQQFVDDLVSGVKADLERSAKATAEAAARGEGKITGRGTVKGDFTQPVTELKKTVDSLESLLDKKGTQELNKILSDSDLKDMLPGGVIYKIANGLPTDKVLSTKLKEISGLKNTRDVINLEDKITRMNQNLLQTYRNKFKHSALDDLDKVNYKTMDQKSLIAKISTMGIFKSMLERLKNSRLKDNEIQANAIADINGLLSNPFYRDASGRSYGDIARSEIAKADATLAKGRESKKGFGATSAGLRGGMFIGRNLNKE